MAHQERTEEQSFGKQSFERHRCPICCILPPHMLDKMLQQDDPEHRHLALKTLRASEQFRGRRTVVGNVSFAVSPGQKRRTIYDAKTGTSLPGVLVRGEGDPPSNDEAVNEAYDGSGVTYDLFRDIYERNSLDDRGLRLDSTVHYDVQYDNAFWNGDQMVYGDGDDRLFNRFTISLDVIAHELTHGVISYEADLEYKNESGALNESFADVFGSLVKQRSLQQTADQADWLIGAEQFTSRVQGIALRSLKAPGTAYDDPVLGKDPQTANYKDLFRGTFDDGGVHINSGIPNRAFHLAAVAIGGFAWEKAGKIWYTTLRSSLQSRANFKDAADATVSVAGQLFGQDSDERKAVQSAWQQVGVG
jgi:Zn-dependent metalloprotease